MCRACYRLTQGHYAGKGVRSTLGELLMLSGGAAGLDLAWLTPLPFAMDLPFVLDLPFALDFPLALDLPLALL